MFGFVRAKWVLYYYNAQHCMLHRNNRYCKRRKKAILIKNFHFHSFLIRAVYVQVSKIIIRFISSCVFCLLFYFLPSLLVLFIIETMIIIIYKRYLLLYIVYIYLWRHNDITKRKAPTELNNLVIFNCTYFWLQKKNNKKR